MNFIKADFKLRLWAIRFLLHYANELWEEKDYLGYIRILLWAVFCTVVGIFLLPITLIISAYVWHNDFEGHQATLDDIIDEYNL